MSSTQHRRDNPFGPDDALAKTEGPLQVNQCARRRQPWLQPSSAPDSWDAVLYLSLPNKATRGIAGVAASAESSHHLAIQPSSHPPGTAPPASPALPAGRRRSTRHAFAQSQSQSHLHDQNPPVISSLAHACGSVVALLHVVSTINLYRDGFAGHVAF